MGDEHSGVAGRMVDTSGEYSTYLYMVVSVE